ncbi:nicotinamidase [Leucobacter denitrificans]|uniref:nicotinamidase n=1 Tax=Leucobacter denitrificans TaxID=683042 RepID=A0A7G9S6E2_9MICO|nr:nicotinamidase [Leucobacter denitrificans]QNN63417.1 nicotinamidase [Leucobacter denitrificans]
MARALLIVDVQNDFTEGGALGVEGGSRVASGVTELLQDPRSSEQYELIAASRDWHDAEGDNGGHFASEGADPDFVSTWPVHCVADTNGADYHPSLDIDHIDVHVRKGMGEPAYSAFEGEAVDGSTLAEVLRSRGIDELDVVGIATDYCVRASALDAVNQGLRVRVLSDLIAGVAAESSVAALKELAAAGVEIV